MKFGMLESDIFEITKIVESFPEVLEAKIFGSRAKGNHRRGSDVDIALIGDDINLDVVAKIHFILEEESRMPYLFDVVDYTHSTHTALREHIERVGITIFKRAG